MFISASGTFAWLNEIFFFLPRVVNAFLLVWASYLLMKVQITAKNSDYGRVRCRNLVISQLRWLNLSHQCVSNFNVHSDHLRILLKFRFWFSRSGVGLKILLRNRLPCNALMKHLLNKKDMGQFFNRKVPTIQMILKPGCVYFSLNHLFSSFCEYLHLGKGWDKKWLHINCIKVHRL